MSGCGHEHEDGAYVLGALSPEERLAFERHLPGCATCSTSLRELAGLPGLLARVPEDVLAGAAPSTPVPDTLLPGVLHRARRRQRRQAWVTAGLVAAGLVIGAGGAAAVLRAGDEPPPATAGPTSPPSVGSAAASQPLRPVGAEPISAWVSMTEVRWGTKLELTCRYAARGEGYPHHRMPRYAMFVTRANGRAEQVASWRALPGRTMHLSAATAAGRADIADVDVRTSDGHTVLRLD